MISSLVQDDLLTIEISQLPKMCVSGLTYDVDSGMLTYVFDVITDASHR